MSYRETIILSLGGSLIVPNGGIDNQFLVNINKSIRHQIAEKNRRFFIICGGGETARNYIAAGTKVVGKTITHDDQDWLGIHSTRLNAHLMRTVFRDIAYPRIFKHYDREYDIKDEPIVICSGWKPGWSTDYCAVLIAEQQGAKTIINMSNIDKVYDKDPRKYKDARSIDKTTWDYFEKLVGDKWIPGFNAPFDPVATQLAKKLGLTVIILNGRNIPNFESALNGAKFVGTVITPFTLDASFYDREYYEGEKTTGGTKYFKFFRPIESFCRALMIKLLLHPKKVLEIGCGFGYKVYFLRKLGVEAYGLDISTYAMKTALPQVKEYLTLGDIRKLPFKDAEFDLVFTFDVLQHIHPEDLDKAVSECKRVTSKFILHKIYTQENIWYTKVMGTELSQVSVLPRKSWKEKWKRFKLKISSRFWPNLPRRWQTVYLLEK